MRRGTSGAEVRSGVSTEMWRTEMRSATARMAAAAKMRTTAAAGMAAATAGVSSPAAWVSTAAATGLGGKRSRRAGCRQQQAERCGTRGHS